MRAKRLKTRKLEDAAIHRCFCNGWEENVVCSSHEVKILPCFLQVHEASLRKIVFFLLHSALRKSICMCETFGDGSTVSARSVADEGFAQEQASPSTP